MSEKSNVHSIRTGRQLFTPHMRQKVTEGLSSYTDKPEEAANRVEDVICTAIVGILVTLGTALGKKVAERFVKETSNTRKVSNIR